MKLLFSFVVLVMMTGTLLGQQTAIVPSATSELSILLSWRWESADGYSTVDVCSDRLLLFEGSPVEYELYDHAFYFPQGGGPVRFSYSASTDRLTLTYPEGPPLEYRRVLESVYARRTTRRLPSNDPSLYGKFCTSNTGMYYSGSSQVTGTKGIFIAPSGEFDFSPRPTYAPVEGIGETSTALGTAVLCGNAVIFSFYSGGAAEGEVAARDQYGGVAAIKYLKDMYEKGACPGPASPEPGPTPVPEPPYPPYPDPSTPVVDTPAQPVNTPEPPKRDIGNTRGDANTQPGGTTDTGKRGTGTRR